jgi:transcriptional regulator with GAF, ATPase, and Fis domain
MNGNTTPMGKQSQLVALTGPALGSIFPLEDGEVSIGHGESDAVYLEDDSISDRQCVIQRAGTGFKLRDLDRIHRTMVNGLPVTEYTLEDRDEIKVGTSRFLFVLDGEYAQLQTGADIVEAGATVVLLPDQAVYLEPGHVVDSLLQPGRTARNLKSMFQASAAVSGPHGLRELQWGLMDSLAQSIPAERGAILLAADSAPAFHWSRHGDADQPFHVPRSILNRVLEEGVGICLNDVLMSSPVATSESVVLSRINSVLAAPLTSGEERVGAIYVDAHDHRIRFDEDHLQLLTGIAGVAAAPLAQAWRLTQLENENRRLEAELRGEHDMVGDSTPMREVYKFIRKTAPTNSTVLIEGESGTGKELVARAVHRNSPRAANRFVAINCAAITETLLESEFFGHEKGAFTGAVVQKKGKLEEGNGGTVFLDEIGELAPPLQAKLLRVLQEREFERVGGTRTIKVDIRIVAATNRDLGEMARRGTFRMDLYYRLNVVSVTLPPLRQRREDIPFLANHFLQKHRFSAGRRILGLSNEARNCLVRYDWPGNVREMENAIERAVVLGTTEQILPEDFPDSIVESEAENVMGEPVHASGKFHDTIREIKRQLVLKALGQAHQSYPQAAKLLGLHPNNLYRLMKTLNLKDGS